MDTRRTVMAIAICFLILFGWQYFSENMGWAPKREPAKTENTATGAAPGTVQTGTDAPAASTGGIQQGIESVPAPAQFSAGREIVVDTPLYVAKFNSVGGILTSFEFKRYTVASEFNTEIAKAHVQMIDPRAQRFAPMGVLINNQHTWRNASWSYELGDSASDGRLSVADGQQGSVTFIGRLGELTIRRTITFSSDTYVLSEKLDLISDTPQTVGLGYSISTTNLAGPDEYMKVTRVARMQGGSFGEEDSTSDLSNGLNYGGNVTWGGNMSNYFLAAMIPADNSFGMQAKLQDDVYTVAFKKDSVDVLPGSYTRSEMSYYFGPKDMQALEAAPGNLITSVDYGWFGWIATPLLTLLKFFHSYVNNWGVAIILLTVLVKLVLWPLSYKSYKSMQGMKTIQPHMAKIREKYKDDKQRMNQEMMQLYRTYKVNPMGGCLPILVQLPVFIGLYKALLNAFELRQAAFIPYLPFTDNVWLYDLSLQDPYYITPIVMGALMFLQQKLTPTPGDPTQAKIMLFMPIIFVFFFLSFPSGLVVYWLMNSLLSVAQQHWQLNMKGAKKAKS